MLLALRTGARVGSLVSVRLVDVDLEARTIWFAQAKNDRPYGVPLDRAGIIAARHLVAEARSAGRERLIGVGATRVRQWVHGAEQDAGLPRIWPHLFRHAFATRVAQANDPEAWRRLMNHADLSQWARYNHADQGRLRGVLEHTRG
jgi:integrase